MVCSRQYVASFNSLMVTVEIMAIKIMRATAAATGSQRRILKCFSFIGCGRIPSMGIIGGAKPASASSSGRQNPFIQAAADGVEKPLRVIWLLQEKPVGPTEKTRVLANHVQAVAAHENRLQRRTLFAYLPGEFPAGDAAGHDHVSEQQINSDPLASPYLQGFAPRGGF